jgi:YD repeat-containing protein
VRDASGRVQSVYDPAGHQTAYAYDVPNRVDSVSVYESVGPLWTHYYYNAMGTIDSVVDPRRVKRSWRYDAAGRPIWMTDDVGNNEYRLFNHAGFLDSLQTRVGYMIRYTHDAAGRETQMMYPQNAFIAGTTVPGDTILRTYDAVGRLLTARNHTGVDSLVSNLEGTVRSDKQVTTLSVSPPGRGTTAAAGASRSSTGPTRCITAIVPMPASAR